MTWLNQGGTSGLSWHTGGGVWSATRRKTASVVVAWNGDSPTHAA